MKKPTVQESMKDLKARKHSTPLSTAAKMIKKYKAFRKNVIAEKGSSECLPDNTPDLPLYITFNKKAITALMKEPGCVGLRITPAINSDNKLTFILDPIDANREVISGGNEIGKPGGTTTDEGQWNPPYA
jgi:hypothetical protein